VISLRRNLTRVGRAVIEAAQGTMMPELMQQVEHVEVRVLHVFRL
jgi:hypothetical protein